MTLTPLKNLTIAALAALSMLLAGAAAAERVRVATFNVSLFRDAQGKLRTDLERGNDEQARLVGEIIQKVDPDILLLNEFDHDPGLEVVFNDLYLNGRYPYHYNRPVNSGTPSGLDLDGNGKAASLGEYGYADDAFGFGRFPGQYGMLVFSKYPIEEPNSRSFQLFRWGQMPDANRPVFADGRNYYTDEIWRELRLSSKSHWDVSIQLSDMELHLLASHPTPPVFDGEEDRGGRRNSDEIRFWADYVSGESYMIDDRGNQGGLAEDAVFIIAGDLNADPNDGDSYPGAITQLLSLPVVNGFTPPASEGAKEAAMTQGGINAQHKTDPRTDTADWSDKDPGNLRVDYLLASRCLEVTDSGVFWPESGELDASLIPVSDHRLVWIDVRLDTVCAAGQ